MAELSHSSNLYQLRLVLAGVSPMIWRRLLISSETSISQLHQYIQIAFDWSGEHLHRFRIHGKDYGIAYLGGISFEDNPRAVYLSRFRLRLRESFRYEYDFTAEWRVNIRLEKILPLDRRLVLPTCSDGRGTAPGEEYCRSSSVFATSGPSRHISLPRTGNDGRRNPGLAGCWKRP
jgi:hypothetical protein